MKKILISLVLLATLSTLVADPLILKGADGSWLPVIAREWHEKGDGVLTTFKTKENSKIVRNTLLSNFPEMDIEIHGNTLFFPQTSLYSLFNRISSIDFKITVPRNDPIAVLKANRDTSLVKNRNKEKITPSMVSGRIILITTEAKTGKVFFTLSVTKRAQEGMWKRIRGVKKIFVQFEMKDGIALANSYQNLGKAPILMAKKGDMIAFTPQSRDKKTGLITLQSLITLPQK